jgi:hypothetical protein
LQYLWSLAVFTAGNCKNQFVQVPKNDPARRVFGVATIAFLRRKAAKSHRQTIDSSDALRSVPQVGGNQSGDGERR